MENQAGVVAEMMRVLKPGGKIIILDFDRVYNALERGSFDPGQLFRNSELRFCNNQEVRLLNPGGRIYSKGDHYFHNLYLLTCTKPKMPILSDSSTSPAII